MAKLKTPLLSFGASGAIGKTMVLFPWKGLDCAREYVIPANPNTTAQQTQRGYVEDAVDDIHQAQITSPHGLGPKDVAAYALWASCMASPRTWFNQVVKNWIDQHVKGKKGTTYRGVTLTPASGKVTIVVYSDEIDTGKIETGNFMWGTSKTALINTQAATPDLVNHKMTADIDPGTHGTKIYAQFVPATTADYAPVPASDIPGALSGIFSDTTT